MSSASALGRIAAVAALIAALAVIGYLFLGGGAGSYAVTGYFQNAGQIVKGNEVEVAGQPAGSIEDIWITDDGQAAIKFTVEDRFAPLPRGTKATIRATSLSGIANRYIQLDLPSKEAAGATIPDGGTLTQTATVTPVDLDQLFNTLDERTRTSLQRFLKGSADMWRGRGREGNRGFRYLNPFLSTSSRVFDELNRDTATFESLVVHAGRLTAALAERRDDISALVGNLNRMMGAIGGQKAELAAAVGDLPDFMRRANTTFVNLRAALGDLDPLVNASKPATKRLKPFLRELRPFAADAEPTIAALNDIVRKPGSANDLVDLQKLQPALTEIAVGPVTRNGAKRQGALQESAKSLDASLPNLANLRPYAPELVGWFDGFAHTGKEDANGSFARLPPVFSAFNVQGNGLLGAFIPPEARPTQFKALAGNVARCPGALERPTVDDSVPFTDGGKAHCDPKLGATGK